MARLVAAIAPGLVRIGLELGTAETFGAGALNAWSYLELHEGLPSAELVDATNLVLEVRLVKSPAEIACMRQAGQSTRTGLKAAIVAITRGAYRDQHRCRRVRRNGDCRKPVAVHRSHDREWGSDRMGDPSGLQHPRDR